MDVNCNVINYNLLSDEEWSEILKYLTPFFTHNHSDASNFRLKDSINKCSVLVDTHIKKGHSGVCLTDHETISNHIKIMQYVNELKKDNEELKDFKLGLGNEIYLVDSLEEVRDNYKSGETKFYHYVLLAKDREGHKQLRELSSKAWLNSFKTGLMERVPTIKKEMYNVINKNKGHLIATTACVGGEFLSKVRLLLQATEEEEIRKIKWEIDEFIQYNLELFEEDFYIEIQPTEDEELIAVNKEGMRIAKAYGIKILFSTDAHYPVKEMAKVHESFLKSKEGEREVASFYATTYIMTVEEMWNYFKDNMDRNDFIDGINTGLEVKNKIEDYSLSHDVIVPEIDLEFFECNGIFSQWYDKYDYINKFAHSDYDQDRWLLKIVEDGFIEKEEEFNDENMSRINLEFMHLWEISIKLKQRMSSYYNLVEYIVNLMWDEKRGNSLVGIARGSVTGYYICYLINITQMNPIKWDLPEWRHLHSERPELPNLNWALIVNSAKRCA